LTSVAFIPHLILYIGYGTDVYLSELTEVLLYLAAGAVIGGIAGRESKLRKKYKSISEKLSNSYGRLHKETELLIQAEEQLGVSQKLSALGELAASLAHEIKNPLSSIKGTAEILLDEFPNNHPKREFVEILLTEVSRLNTSVEHVLRFSRKQNKKKDSAAEPLSDVILRVSRLLEAHGKGKFIDFKLSDTTAADNFYINGDKFSQVLLNIILNAIDAVSGEGKIHVEIKKSDNGLLVSISDNGPGIPIADRERIFEPFVSDKEDGTGLGLSISRKIIASYGGDITVSESKEGGACFTISLPDSAVNGHTLE
ncbi:MAG: GHKL domain-containing protein, partial [Deltaproteobacteria bacterium]|nr:GHKL domain-containing protein [Deltaproteobacteria bacterium]